MQRKDKGKDKIIRREEAGPSSPPPYSERIRLTPESPELQGRLNEYLTEVFGTSAWVYRESSGTTDAGAFQRDAKASNVFIDGLNFGEASTDLDTFFKQQFSDTPASEAAFTNINKYWSQSLPGGIFKNVILATGVAFQALSTSQIANLKMDENDNFYLEVTVFNIQHIKYDPQSGVFHQPIPGSVTYRLDLTDKGFKFAWMDFTNPLLKEIWLKGIAAEITPSSVQSSLEEEFSSRLKEIRYAILTEAAKYYSEQHLDFKNEFDQIFFLIERLATPPLDNEARQELKRILQAPPISPEMPEIMPYLEQLISESKHPTLEQSHSSFTNYLKYIKHLNPQLIDNLKDKLNINGFFVNFPTPYLSLNRFLDPSAFVDDLSTNDPQGWDTNPEFNTWLSLIKDKALHDLFDENANLRSHLCDVLEIDEKDALNFDFKREILTAYLQMAERELLVSQAPEQKLKIEFLLAQLTTWMTTIENEEDLIRDPDLWRIAQQDAKSKPSQTLIAQHLYDTARQDLRNTLSHPDTNPNIKEKATAVLKEIERIKAAPNSSAPTIKLANILQSTNKMVKDPSTLDQSYVKESREVGKRSWGKVLGGVMGALVLAVYALTPPGLLMIAAGVGLAAIGGIAIAAHAPIIGSGALAASGYLFFKSRFRKQAPEAMTQFINATEEQSRPNTKK